MIGTVRTFSESVRSAIHEKIKRTAEGIAQAAGARVTVETEFGYPVTSNDPALVARMLPTLRRVAGAANVFEQPRTTTAEDFSRYAQIHSPLFEADESALPVGVRTMTALALDYLSAKP
jgi:metal-dependent amidase/aminoacylase/carboxypeptidase family protein